MNTNLRYVDIWRRRAFMTVAVLSGIAVFILPQEVGEDYVRSATLAMGLYIVLFSLRIVMMNLWIAKRMTGKPMGLLPVHIIAIACSYVFFVVSTHVWVADRWGTDFHWYGLPLIFIGDMVGVFALTVIWRVQKLRRVALGHKV